MITIILCTFFGIFAGITAKKGEWGSFAIAVIIILFLLWLKIFGRDDDLAEVHRMEYWAEGGPNAKRNRSKGRKASDDDADSSGLLVVGVVKSYVCASCKSGVYSEVADVTVNGKKLERCICPVCGKATYFKKG